MKGRARERERYVFVLWGDANREVRPVGVVADRGRLSPLLAYLCGRFLGRL